MMDERTLTALKGSIAKWEAIVAGTGVDDGATNCALCQAFPRCECCPVAERAEIDCCDNTPWIKWFDHHYNKHGIKDRAYSFPLVPVEGCRACKQHAKAELDFLKSLLPPPATEAD